jgi:hypothetical protein
MPTTQEEVDALFDTLRAEWNTSEGLVKTAEQVCGEAVIPSIKEFRYAGRRVVEALHESAKGGDLAKAKDFVQDAIFNCHRARHDAIDAATAIMAATLLVAVNKIGYQHILTAFPDFAKLRKELSAVRGKIRLSRENRDDRDAIYISLNSTDFPALMVLYEDYQNAEDIMRSLARNQRREILFLRVTTGLAVAAAVISATVNVYQATHPPTPVAATAPIAHQQAYKHGPH